MRFLLSVIFVSSLLAPIAGFAWNDEATHPTISEKVATDFFGESFVKQEVNGKMAIDLVKDGAKSEDKGSIWQFRSGDARSLNHFHNPARATLSEAGLTDLPSSMAPGMSTLLWAQDKEAQKTRPQGDWSWNTVRDYQYRYVTALSKTEEDQHLGNMLKGLGFQMHLVQDMGQPNHVRNDTHIWDGASIKMGLETWAKVNDIKVKEELLGGMQSIPPVTVDLKPAFTDDAGNTLSPVARLSDTRGYKGERAPRASFDQGLAEYTNSNYFSESTIFATERYADENPFKHYNPYPSKNETNVQEFIDRQMGTTAVQDDDFGVFNAIVISKQNTQGEKLNCVATTGPFSNELLSQRGPDKHFYRTFMNEPCFPEYAAKLIPASAAYSAAMLDYFFRGELVVTVPPDLPPANKRIRLKVRNNTVGEAMDGGSVELMVIFRQYKKEGTASAGNLVLDGDYQFRKYTLGGCTDTTPRCQTIGTTDSILDFDLSANPLPPLARDVSLIVVYHGKLGYEQDAVVYKQIYIDTVAGDIELSLPARGVYASVSGEAVSNAFSDFALAAKTTSSTLSGSGTTELLVIYRNASGNPFLSQPVDSSVEIKYASAVLSNTPDISATEATKLFFPLADAPIPVTATDVYAYMIHTAQDGAKSYGVRDISEPTPVDVFNNADKICINGQWHSAGSAEAVALADTNTDGIPDLFDPYAHNIGNIFAKIAQVSTPASATDYTFTAPEILPGGISRRLGYILTDYSFNYSYLEDWLNIAADDPWIITEGAEQYSGTAVKNQIDADGTYTYPGMYTIRGIMMWWGAGVIYDNLNYPVTQSCD